jgi:hypothetical protein
VSTSSSIEVEGSDSGMEQTNEYEGIASLPARERRGWNGLVLQQTFENKEYPSSMPERERKFRIVPSNFRRYREDEPGEKPPSAQSSTGTEDEPGEKPPSENTSRSKETDEAFNVSLARERRLRNDLVLQQTFENKEYPSSMPERERKFRIDPSNFRRYREEDPGTSEHTSRIEETDKSFNVSLVRNTSFPPRVVRSTDLQVGGSFGFQIGGVAHTPTRRGPYVAALERPLERPSESNAWAPPYEVKVDSLEDPQTDSIADIANGRKKSFWQRITAKFAK